jgi:glycosyltransferase involved in cell wall biosynthesis
MDVSPAAEPLNMACLIHSLSGGGAERVMAGLSSRLASRGHTVNLITFDSGSRDRYPVDPCVGRVFLDLSADATGAIGKLRQIRTRYRKLRAAVQAASPDVVLTFCDRNNVDALVALRRTPFPIVVCERSEPGRQSLGPFWDRVRRRVYPQAADVIALTDTAAECLRPFCRSVAVIPSAVEPPRIESDRTRAADAKRVSAAGRLEREKGFDRLLRAFAQATADDPEWKLEIAGEGSQRPALEQLAGELGIEGRLHLPGWVRPLDERLARSTMFCLSSRYEGFPSVLLEAMAMGVPVVSVDCDSGPRHIIRQGRDGLLVDASVEGLAAGLKRWRLEPELRERAGQAGKEVLQRFSWERMVVRFEAVLKRAAAR